MTHSTTPAEIAVAFTQAWARQDMTAVAAFIADDIAFEGPMTSTSGAEAYLAALGGFAGMVQRVDITSVLDGDNEVLLMYDMLTEPFGVLRTAEHMVLDGGKIVRDTVVFDTHELRTAQSGRVEETGA